MKLPHSLGFLLLGGVMVLLPPLTPSLRAAGFYDESPSTIWLRLMGLVQVGIGLSYALRLGLARITAALERWPELIATQSPEKVGASEREIDAVRVEGELIAVSFRTATPERRHAA